MTGVLEGQSAIVTGAARGIGKAIAWRLLDEGCNVVLADLDSAGATEAARERDPSGARTAALALDVRDEASFEAVFAAAMQRFGRLEVLVNNAARRAGTPVSEISAEEWDDVLMVNLRGTFFGCRLAGAHMAPHGYGRIINIGSLAGMWGRSPTGAHYVASKAGIVGLTRFFAFQFAPSGITVNAVSPAAIAGDSGPVPEEVVRTYIQATVPLARAGTPDEVAAVVAFLSSDESGYITGATIDVNGGALMR